MRLIFVYNAKAGVVAGLMDTIHKTVSPSTYACSLCAITHGALAMNKTWKAYLAGLGIPMDFYHRPDFRAAFPAQADLTLPLIGTLVDGRVEVLASAQELGALDSLDGLMTLVDSRLSALRERAVEV
jgi:hypothetical protein